MKEREKKASSLEVKVGESALKVNRVRKKQEARSCPEWSYGKAR